MSRGLAVEHNIGINIGCRNNF